MQCHKTILAILVLVSLFISSCNEDSTSTSPITKDLSSGLEEIYKNSNIPGFSYAIIKNGEVVINNSVGFSNISEGILYSKETKQPVASVSKSILAVAITKAIELGYFTLETNINDILPFEVKNPNFPNSQIKVKHLVTHTSSLVDDIELFFATYQILPGENRNSTAAQFMINNLNTQLDEIPTLEEVVYDYFSAGGDYYDGSHFGNYKPGEYYSYSNFASSLAAYLIEVKSGVLYKDFVKTNIFTPLGMNNTSFEFTENLGSELYAKLYFDKNSAYPKYESAAYPSGSLITTSEDLSKFLVEVLNGFGGQSTSILSKQSYSLMFNSLFIDQTTQVSHGIFWFLEGNSIFHSGNDLGVIAKVHFNKDSKIGFVFMTNTEMQFSSEAAKNLEDVNKILYSLIDQIK